MRKVYNYLNSHPNAMGVVEIEGIKYKISVADNLRHSARPEHEGWTNPYIGVWIICPKEGTYLKIELI
jgi:hypothetical protein